MKCLAPANDYYPAQGKKKTDEGNRAPMSDSPSSPGPGVRVAEKRPITATSAESDYEEGLEALPERGLFVTELVGKLTIAFLGF